MRGIDRLRGSAPAVEERFSLEDLAAQFKFQGIGYGATGLPSPQTTWNTEPTESIGSSFSSYVERGYQSNGVVFAVILARLLLFTEARFQWQKLDNGRPGDLFDNADLRLLNRPWPNATTGDLLARMEQDASLAGNFYGVRIPAAGGDQLRRMRPDRVSIILGSKSGDAEDVDVTPAGYLYWPKGIGRGKPEVFTAGQVCHYAPIPDPQASFRGMSWLTPVVEEIRSDSGATRHKGKFFDNAATPNLAVSLDKAVPKKDFLDLVKAMSEHEGADNAYKTMWLAGGASVQVVGADLKQLDFKATQGAGETRIAAAGGVPPLIVGLSEGLGAATYSNYAQARRKFADGWARPAWRQAAGALESVLNVPTGARLWYDDRDIPFLQEDVKDDAEIAGLRASTIKTLVDAGYEPPSVVAAVESGDLSKLVHSGFYSVQLQALDERSGAADPMELAALIQKIYLGVGTVVSASEAREIANMAGAGLAPTLPTEMTAPEGASNV